MDRRKPVIIFHRSTKGAKEDFVNQQAFLKANQDIIGSTRVVDFASGNHDLLLDILYYSRKHNKYIIIFNSFLSDEEYSHQYKLYYYFQGLRDKGKASFYLMDSEGRLYKEVDKIEI